MTWHNINRAAAKNKTSFSSQVGWKGEPPWLTVIPTWSRAWSLSFPVNDGVSDTESTQHYVPSKSMPLLPPPHTQAYACTHQRRKVGWVPWVCLCGLMGSHIQRTPCLPKCSDITMLEFISFEHLLVVSLENSVANLASKSSRYTFSNPYESRIRRLGMPVLCPSRRPEQDGACWNQVSLPIINTMRVVVILLCR